MIDTGCRKNGIPYLLHRMNKFSKFRIISRTKAKLIIIEKKNEVPSEIGDVGKLYSQVKTLYNMHQNKDLDKRINGLLSGLEKILSAIAEMRNKGSDSHGVGTKRINISEHHARLLRTVPP